MPEWFYQVAAIAAGAITGYAAIKADMARLHERASIALARADSAHASIDNLNT